MTPEPVTIRVEDLANAVLMLLALVWAGRLAAWWLASRRRDDDYGEERRFLRRISNRRCALCGRPIREGRIFPHPESEVIDHVWPQARGGSNHWTNLALAHNDCNLRKSAKLPSLWLRWRIYHRNLRCRRISDRGYWPR